MSDFVDALQKLADTLNADNGELAHAVLQRLSTATDERRAVPRVYRGLECLAPTDPGPVRGTRISPFAGLCVGMRSTIRAAVEDEQRRAREARSAGPARPR